MTWNANGKIESDEFTSRKAAIEQQIARESAKREADWIEREKVLAEQQEMIPKYRAFVEAFPSGTRRCRAKGQRRGLSPRWRTKRSSRRSYLRRNSVPIKNIAEQKIAALKETIEQQVARLEHLSAQLHAAQKHVQDLAVKAVESTGKAGTGEEQRPGRPKCTVKLQFRGREIIISRYIFKGDVMSLHLPVIIKTTGIRY